MYYQPVFSELLFGVVSLVCVLAVSPYQPHTLLKFREDSTGISTFKIVQFTDLHFYHDFTDAETQEVMYVVLETEKPDLVVITGDILSGSGISDNTHGEKQVLRSWDHFTKPLVDGNYKWAITFGNHDDEGPYTRTQLMQLDQSYSGSLSQFGPSYLTGVSNYYIPIYTSDSNNDYNETATVLYLLATSDSNCLNHSGNGCILPSQIDWVYELSQQLKKDLWSSSAQPFSMMFYHIPIPEYVSLWNHELCYGSKKEHCCCPKINTGLYNTALKMGVRAMFVGHDHNNDYCGSFKENLDLSLCYGRKSGWGYYNPPWPMHHGARVIKLTQDTQGKVEWNTWIRNLFGEKEEQMAHSPVGSDQSTC